MVSFSVCSCASNTYSPMGQCYIDWHTYTTRYLHSFRTDLRIPQESRWNPMNSNQVEEKPQQKNGRGEGKMAKKANRNKNGNIENVFRIKIICLKATEWIAAQEKASDTHKRTKQTLHAIPLTHTYEPRLSFLLLLLLLRLLFIFVFIFIIEWKRSGWRVWGQWRLRWRGSDFCCGFSLLFSLCPSIIICLLTERKFLCFDFCVC